MLIYNIYLQTVKAWFTITMAAVYYVPDLLQVSPVISTTIIGERYKY